MTTQSLFDEPPVDASHRPAVPEGKSIRSVDDIEPSGLVPRTLMAGVEWDDAAEARYVGILRSMTDHADAVARKREALWQVEAHLHLKFYQQQIQLASACCNDSERTALYARWVAAYGQVRADRLIATSRDSKAAEALCNISERLSPLNQGTR